jgi:hypothetical protein
MKIKITKRGRRNEMRCLRPDGTSEFADLGPGLPHHDLAHFAVEREWNLRQGFFGKIAGGCTFAQLSDKNVIKNLGPEAAQAEVLTRALQSLSTGACTTEQFADLVNTELAHWHMPTIPVTPAMVLGASARFKALLDRFDALGDGESLQLETE